MKSGERDGQAICFEKQRMCHDVSITVLNTDIFFDMLAHLKVKKNVNTNLDDNLDSVGRDLKESRALYLPQGSSPVQ